MKYWIIVLLLWAGSSKSQTITYTPMNGGYQYMYLKADSGLKVPYIDTAIRRSGVRPGSIVCRPADSLFYGWNGRKWAVMGADVASLITLINQKVDSVTVSGDTLYYWKLGVSYGYVLPTAGWKLTGNTGCDGCIFGTTQPYPVRTYTNNVQREIIDTNGNHGIHNANPDAILDIVSTTSGVLIPRMTTTQRNAISSPPTSLLIYNTTNDEFNYYNGSSWVLIEPGTNVNIYNSDGTLSSTRTLTRGGYAFSITDGLNSPGFFSNGTWASTHFRKTGNEFYSAFVAKQDSAVIYAEGIPTLIIKDSAIKIPYIPDGVGDRAVRWDRITQTLKLADTSSTPTLQQVFNTETGGAVLTKNDTIAGGGFNWRMINMGITSIAQNAKTAVTGANGTANVSPLTVTGGAGGATSYSPAGTVTGGNAGAVNITSGNGGAITGTPTTGIGGTGGDINILAGDGGLGTTLGGTAGSAILQAGTGGGGTSGGAAGYVSLKGGLAGSTGNASGGNIFLIPGTGNGTGKIGTTFLGVSPSYTIRGNTVIGNSSDNYTNLLQVNGSVNINKDSLAITTGKKWKVMIDTATGTLVRDSTTADLSAYLPLAGGTMTGALINSKNGAVSTPAITGTGTWYSGGSATTTKPYLLIEPSGTTSTGWNTSGTGLGINAASGFTGYFQDWQLSGVSKASLDYIGNLTAVGLRSGGEIRGGATAYIYWNARSLMSSPSDGNILLQNQAGTDFTRLQLGGTTSSFPAIARNGTGIDIKLADNSAYTGLEASTLKANNYVSATNYMLSGTFYANSDIRGNATNSLSVIGGSQTTSTLTYKTTTGVGTTGADHIFKVGNNGATEVMRILNSGRIGIGISAPTSKVQITGSDSKLTLGDNSGTSARGEIIMYHSSGSQSVQIAATSGQGADFIGTSEVTLGLSHNGVYHTTNGTWMGIGGITNVSATALVNIPTNASTAASTAPLKFTLASANIMATPERGAIEVKGNILYYTDSTATRAEVQLNRYVAKSIDYTATSADYVIVITATGKTITLPTAVGITGRIYTIKLSAIGTGTVATTSSQTIDGSTTYSMSAQYKYVTIQSDGANWNIIGNN